MKEENFIRKQKSTKKHSENMQKKKSSSRGIKLGSKRKFNFSEYKTIIYNNLTHNPIKPFIYYIERTHVIQNF